MAAVLATQPKPIEELVPITPPALDRIVSRCLEKDPEDRWQSARDVAAELLWIAQGGSKAGLPAVISGRRRVREKLAWTACGLATIAAAAFAVAWVRRAPQPAPVVRFALTLPASLQNVSPPVVSPDGRNIVFAADSGGQRMLWIRPMDAIDTRPLPGTEGVYRPFWSPDSRFVGFIAAGKLKKVDIAGGPPQTICDVAGNGDGSWSPQGVILFDGTINDPLREVPAAGGLAKPVVLEEGKPNGTLAAGWPEFLPDGRHFLYMVVVGGAEMTLKVGLLGSTESKTLFKVTTRVQYAAPGYLLFVRDRTLVAQKFDAASQTVDGEPIPLGEGLGTDTVGLASFSVSRTGVLVYRGGELSGSRLVWVDRSGKETAAIDATGEYHDTWLSPDRTRLVYDMGAASQNDIWIRDLARGVSSRFTFGQGASVVPVWSPDGRRIVYTNNAKGPGDLYIKDASGTRDAEPLLVDGYEKYVSDWSPDGKYLLISQRGKDSKGWDIVALPMDGDRKPAPIVRTQFNELWATFSPDWKYIAYQSNESGRPEIYVQEFPDARTKWQISTNGGVEPYWRRDGKELFYRSGRNIMGVPIQIGGTFAAGTPAPIVETRFAVTVARGLYRPAPDGQRFLVLEPRAAQVDQPASVVLNWASALRQ